MSLRYRKSQIKAAVRVNSEMIVFYWSLGKDIVEKQYDNHYGSSFYKNLSSDLIKELPNVEGTIPTIAEIEDALKLPEVDGSDSD